MSIFGTSKPFICEITASLTISTTTYSGGYITVTTTGAHGLVTDECVYITGVATMTDANGIYNIIKIDATSFKFLKTTAQGSGSGGSIRIGYKFSNSAFEFDFTQPDQINHRSVITGVKTNTFLGDYGEFNITERIWQKTTNFTAKLRFTRLYSFYHTDIWLLPQGTLSIKDNTSADVACYFKEFRPTYYKGYINYDAVVCRFETNKYHDITKLLI